MLNNKKYSFLSIARNALTNHENWQKTWKSPEPKKNYDAIIAIGCVIKGETDHYDYICSSVSNGISQLNVNGSTPVIFCVLTDHNKDQSIARSGGKQGNKGTESAIAAIKMAALK